MKSLANNDNRISKSIAPKVLVTGDVLFEVVGDILITSLISECYTPNDATASTLQYSVTTNEGQTQTISSVNSSLANAIKGTTLTLVGNALANMPVISASGVELNTSAGGIRVPPGQIKVIIGVGSTTGTWTHYLSYEPLEENAYVIAH